MPGLNRLSNSVRSGGRVLLTGSSKLRRSARGKLSGRRIFTDVVFGETIVWTRGEADIVAIWMAVGDDDIEVEHGRGQRIAAFTETPEERAVRG
jgi:hypothetical protein